MVLECEITEDETALIAGLELLDDIGHDTVEVEIAEAIPKECII